MNDGRSGKQQKRYRREKIRSQRLVFERDRGADENEFSVVSLNALVKFESLPGNWRIDLTPIVQLMSDRGWNKVELALYEDVFSFVDGERSTLDIFSIREIREAAKSVVWHLWCLAELEVKRGAIRELDGRVYFVDNAIADLEKQIDELRCRREGLLRQTNNLVIEVAELSVGFETALGVPSQTTRDFESARIPRGRHHKVRSAAK